MIEQYKKMIQRFKRDIGVEADSELLFKALCHSSFTNEIEREDLGSFESNERLEFLGDAVLDLCVADILFNRYSVSEGTMSKVRAVVASEEILARVSKDRKIGNYLLLGKGEEKSGGRERDSILADALEAVLGAIYLSNGLSKSKRFVYNILNEYIERSIKGKLLLDYKTALQELTQGLYGIRPDYILKKEEGIPPDNLFIVSVNINNEEAACGKGKTKKGAEQEAARKAYRKMKTFLEGKK
ncbi:MAG: ribonuclease III [Kosmotoga sp.]|nr:MAG: ribonuclease III [Kosmotoga sp.]